MILTNFLWVASLNVCILLSAAQQSTNVDPCRTPDNQSGTCINIKNCTVMKDLLNKESGNPTVRTYLINSQCGSEKNDPKVCCPSSNQINLNLRLNFPVASPTSTNTLRPSSLAPANSPTCGQSGVKVTRNIFGAEREPKPGDWPWMVALGYRTSTRPGPEFKCGGALITNEWVVTAAHCITEAPWFTMTTARVGDVVLRDNGTRRATQINIPVDRIILHPNHTSNPLTNDIALIHLQNPVQFNGNIHPICLFNKAEQRDDSFYNSKAATVIGWGRTEKQESSNALLETTVQISDTTDCANKYLGVPRAVIDKRTLCASRPKKDSCQGDSGGPLFFPEGNSYYLAGIVSFGLKCADPNAPGVYTRAAPYYNWIASVVGL